MANTLKFGNGQWATKVGSTLAYNDEGGNFKPLPFDFTRASSATRVNKDGLIEVVTNNKPRIDFLNDSNGALLLEPTRSNIVPYSEDFNNAAWNKISATITHNDAISPDGTQNSDLFVPNSSGGQLFDGLGSKSASAISYTTSLYVKPKGLNSLRIYLHGTSNANRGDATFNLSNQTVSFSNEGAFTNTSASILSVGNGWYRCILVTTSDTSTSLQLVIRYDGSTDNVSGLNLWGCQTEQGSYATSYIPTQGGVGTRVAETCNGAGNDQVINSTEGVLYYEGSALADDLTNRAISLSDGTANNGIQIFYYNVSNRMRCRVYSGGVLQNTITIYGYTITDTHKIALKWESGFMSVFIDGVINGTALAITSTPVGLDRLNLDLGQGSSDFFGNVKDVRVYNTALTDAELIALTTI